MIKWPNDIVIRDHGGGGEGDRKIAGILIELSGRHTQIGIGINCLQGGGDWGADIRGQAISLSEIGAQVSRLDLACSLVEHLSHWLDAQDSTAIQNYYEGHNAMMGTLRTFRYDNRCYHGIVEFIDPLDCIVIHTPSGTHTLPIAQTRHIPGDEPCCFKGS